MERIYVTVRARPLTPEDAKTSPWRISSNSISLSTNLASKFEFDRIFGEHCKTVEVYEARTKDIVGAALRGFNGTVFAYGQTNSGKTHTMRGTATEPGVIPLAVRELFNIIQEFTPRTKIPLNVLTNWCYVTVDEVIVIVKLGDVGLKLVLLGCNQTFNDKDREFLLRMSYMEIYNEDINDLLAPEHRKLQIHESPERGIYVAGLREEIVASPEQVLDLMEFGESHRHIGETNMNVYSSRSHTIFRMIIESRDKVEAEDVANHCDAVRVSVLNLVDLAGSERAAKTGAGGVRLKEGSHINKSLMTLGTVIKKLSEGAESQGGHVPYRDSKLTRILQPALGGNANTAIICNITLAQIHADETKSSLQFASRALRVTNCARVNEVLTDAALLKRQKKEIEELRAKLQGSHSVHHEEEILNLRNTLLQTELERERIALELEEEKKAQAEWERRLQEQAKKIENLSSMVLYSNRDESRELYKKDKRRDTWCPGNLSREALGEAYSTAHLKSSTINPTKPKRHMGPLLPFEELVGESEADVDDSCKEEENHQINAPEDCTLPYPLDLSRVTNRKKASLGKKSLPVDNNDLVEIQARHKDLLLQLETQGTMKGIEIDCLTRKLGEGDAFVEVKDNNNNSSNSLSRSSLLSGSPILARSPFYGDKNISSRESEAIFVIKHLQEQIKILEMEKSSSQKNLDSVVELATEQNICAREKYEELYEELVAAQEEARLAREQLTSNDCYKKIEEVNLEPSIKLLAEVHGLIFGVQNSSNSVEDISFLVDECLESFSAILTLLLDHKSFMSQNSMQLKSTIGDYQKLCHSMREIIARADNEKSILQFQIEELRLELQNSENAMKALSEQDVMEKSELLTHIEVLEKELSCLSTQALAKEKENLRKDLEKTKKKLETTEFKLKNAIQEKTKLESEKAHAEREIKRLHGQKTLLERDITKRDSLAVRKHESVIDRTSNLFDAKKGKGHAVPFEQLQDDYQQLEVLAFEMETTIASLEEELSAASAEKEEAVSKNQILASEVEALSDKLNISTSQLIALQEEVSGLVARLGESEKHQKQLERSIKLLVEEKEELAMQLTDALLEIEEEKAIWTSKERASIEIIEEKAKLYNAEIMAFSKGLSEVKNELETCKEERNVLEKMLSCTKGDAEWEKNCSEKALVMDQQTIDLKRADDDTTQEDLSNQVLDLKLERDKLSAQIAENQSHMVELDSFQKNYDELAKAKFEVEEITRKISSMEAKMHNDEVSNSKEKAKLRMRLRSTQTKLDVFRGRHMEAVDELDFMNKKFEEASAKLKEKLASCCAEVLNLKKQLATANASSIHQAS